MKAPRSDDDLRQRLQELGRREAETAPDLEGVLQRRQPTSVGSGAAGWLRAAAALAGVLLVVAAAWWWPTRPDGRRPVVGQSERASSDAAEPWELPTDGLLTETRDGAGKSEVDRLSREIEGLLQP